MPDDIMPAEQRVLDAIVEFGDTDPVCPDESVFCEHWRQHVLAALREYGAEQRAAVLCTANNHCWVVRNEVLLTNPPQYLRYCKHCNAQQVGRPQDSMAWEDR